MIEFKNNFRIEFKKGDTYALKITFKNITQDLTTAFFSVKENADDTTALIEKSIGSGISKVDGNYYKQQAVYKLQLQAEDSQNLQVDNLYLYDLKVAVGNVIKTVISGNFVVKQNVTSVEKITTTLADIEVDDVIEVDVETTPATHGIEYEQDPVAMAKIGDITQLNTTEKQNLVSAINEVNTKATASAEEITKIENGTVSVPEATHATSADNATTADSATTATTATNATNATNVQNVDLSADTSAEFGNYVIQRKKIISNQATTLPIDGTWATLYSSNSDRITNRNLYLKVRLSYTYIDNYGILMKNLGAYNLFSLPNPEAIVSDFIVSEPIFSTKENADNGNIDGYIQIRFFFKPQGVQYTGYQTDEEANVITGRLYGSFTGTALEHGVHLCNEIYEIVE